MNAAFRNMEEVIIKTAEVLGRGGVIIYPTDTIWGLGCDATNAAAVEKIYSIKHRDPQKSMLIICADMVMVREYVAEVPEKIESFLDNTNQPTTVIYPEARCLPTNLMASDGSIGIRIPKSEFCRALLEKFGKPIVSTSANFTGQKAPSNFSEIDAKLLETVDFVVPESNCDSVSNTSSHIVKLSPDGSFLTLR